MIARIRPQVAAALALFAAALAVFAYTARGFDRSLRDHDVALAPAVWAASPVGPWTAPLGRFDVPSYGVLRVVACPVPIADPHATLELLDPRTGRSLESHALAADESRGNRCFDASYRTRQATAVVARIRFARATRAPRVASIETSASRRIMPWSIAPVLTMLVAFVLVITAPRRARAIAPAPSEPEAPPAPEVQDVSAWAAFGGVIPAGMIPLGAPPPAVDPVTGAFVLDPAYRVAARAAPVENAPTPPVEWRLSWLLALLAYVATYVLTGLVGAAYMLLAGRAAVLETASFLVVTLLVQHGLLALVAALFLGAFDGRRSVRDALGLIAITPRQVVEAVGLGLALCGVAAGSTHFIHDVSVSPMGRMIEHVPVRYAIGFGALLAPLTEELFFRGVLVRAFGKKSPIVGVVAGAIVFTAAHAMQLQGAWIGLVPICAVAVVNGWLRIRTGGITQPWLVHTVYNLVLSAGLYLG